MSRTDNQSLPQESKRRRFSWRGLIGLLIWIVLPLVLGIWLSRQLIPTPKVAIIRLNMDIYSFSAEFISKEIEEAQNDPSIKAAVLQIDSPGGEVAATQTLYMNLLDLRKTKPLVGSIDSIAASGAYYAALATDPLYAKPSSTVGNIGVWGFYPPVLGVNDAVLASGPFKLTASNQQEFEREIESVKQEFLAVVQQQRGSKLTIPVEDISQGLAYPGRLALSYGLIDDLLSMGDAVKRAAEMAGLRDYETVDLETLVIEKYYSDYFVNLNWYGAADPKTGERALPPGLYLLYDSRLGSTR